MALEIVRLSCTCFTESIFRFPRRGPNSSSGNFCLANFREARVQVRVIVVGPFLLELERSSSYRRVTTSEQDLLGFFWNQRGDELVLALRSGALALSRRKFNNKI